MADSRNSRIFKFKLSDVSVTVTVDGSFCSENREKRILPFSDWHHYHAEYELFIAMKDPFKIDTEGGVSKYCEAAVCVPPLFKHRAIRENDFRLFFDYANLCRKAKGFGDFMNSLSTVSPTVLKINDSVRFYVTELNELLKDGNSVPDEVVASVLKMLFYSLYRENHVEKEMHRSSGAESYLVKIDMIIANYKDDITLGYVAEKLGLSPRQTSRVITKYYKSTLSELVTNQRLNVARLMLLSGEHSVSEIVEKVNFSSESYFYSRFKKKYGMTPLKYKKKNKISEGVT